MQLRGVVSLEGDILVVFYYLNATKRGGLSGRGHISSIFSKILLMCPLQERPPLLVALRE
jgi:hypothetical protein